MTTAPVATMPSHTRSSKRPMRVLALTHRVPFPPDKGDKIRTHHLLTRLAARAEVHLICFADPPSDVQHRARLERTFASVRIVPIDLAWKKLEALPALASLDPLTLAVFHEPALERDVAERIASVRPDVIYAESSSMAPYALAHPEVPFVMDFVDIDSEKWRACAETAALPMRWVYQREAWTLERFERRVATHAACCTVTAPRERELLERIAPRVPSRVLANGVDTEYFVPIASAASAHSIVFFGAMDYVANVEAAVFLVERVLPRVRAHVPDAAVTLAGSNPTAEVRALARVAGVRVTGAVPDIRPYVQGASMSVCPLRVARGVQNKVLEAMAMGVPVVASEAAAEGIEATPGHDLVVARWDGEGRAIADAIVALIRDPARRAALAANGRERVVTRYAWEPRADELHDLLADVARAAQRETAAERVSA